MQVFDLLFADSFVQPLLDNGASKVVQFSFPLGHKLEKQRTTSDILIFVISGQVEFTAGKKVTLQAGNMLNLEKNVEHHIEALADSVVVLVATPSPTAHSLFKPGAGVVAGDPHEGATHPEHKASIAPQLQSFVEEHAELLDLLNRAMNGFKPDIYAEVDRMVAEELNQHFRYEEDILFPLLGKYIGTTVGPIVVMLSEHKMIRERHAEFHKRLEAHSQNQAAAADVVEAFTLVENMLRMHINKEDSVLFPMASNVMSEEDKNEVASKVSAEKSAR